MLVLVITETSSFSIFLFPTDESVPSVRCSIAQASVLAHAFLPSIFYRRIVVIVASRRKQMLYPGERETNYDERQRLNAASEAYLIIFN